METPKLQINQTVVTALAIAGCLLAIVLYYENKKMREHLFASAPRQPCNCEENQTNQPVEHSAIPDVMPNNQKPPEVIVD